VNEWVFFEDQLLRAGDEEALAEWHAIKIPEGHQDDWLARMDFVDRYNSGRYFEDRKRARREAEREERTRARRFRALDEGATTTFPTGRQVAAERTRQSMRQEDLARATGIPRDIIAKIERNSRRLWFDEACLVADALGVPLDQLRPS